MEIVAVLWLLCGVIGHIIQANKMKTWCGTPVWEEPSTYVMFLPAAIGGLVTLAFAVLDKEQRR